MDKPKEINFEDIEKKLRKILKKRLKKLDIKFPCFLVKDFFKLQSMKTLHEHIVLGGPYVPFIMVVERETGKMHLLALFNLMPELREKE